MRLKANKRKRSDKPDETYSIRISPLTTKLKKELADVIGKTLHRLPPKTRKKVLDEVNFELESSRKFGSREPWSYTDAGRKEHIPIIVLPVFWLSKRSESYKMRVIAGLIARFILKQRSRKRAISYKESMKLYKKREKKIAALYEKWGFGRLLRTG